MNKHFVTTTTNEKLVAHLIEGQKNVADEFLFISNILNIRMIVRRKNKF